MLSLFYTPIPHINYFDYPLPTLKKAISKLFLMLMGIEWLFNGD